MKYFYKNPKNTKYILTTEAPEYMCPFKDNKIIRCRGNLCMAWKWTGYIPEHIMVAVKSIPGSDLEYCKQEQEKRTLTHGCCGLVYTEEIEPNEMV